MKTVHLEKMLPRQDTGSSAIWLVKNHPWIAIGKWNPPGEYPGWKIIVLDLDEQAPDKPAPPPGYNWQKLKEDLEDQTFPTRLAAVQALSVALELIGEADHN